MYIYYYNPTSCCILYIVNLLPSSTTDNILSQLSTSFLELFASIHMNNILSQLSTSFLELFASIHMNSMIADSACMYDQ